MSDINRPDVGPACRNGDRCIDYDRPTKTIPPAGATALCDPCLDALVRKTGQAVAALPWDLLDLAQLQAPSMAQSLTGQPGGSPDPPMPLAAAPEALTAEIVHVTTTWEDVLRDHGGLSAPAPTNQPWHTTISRRPPPAQGRAGAQVRRAVAILGPRLGTLARLGPTAVYPTGCEDQPTDLDGIDALEALTGLHQRARAMLGRTKRVFWVPGECWQEVCADAHETAVGKGHEREKWLYRSEPAHYRDEPLVHCRYCEEPRPYLDYVRYVEILVWPAEHRGDHTGEAA